MSPKPWYLSKTFWTNAVMLVATALPVVQTFLSVHPALLLDVFAGVNIVLRFLTTTGISIS